MKKLLVMLLAVMCIVTMSFIGIGCTEEAVEEAAEVAAEETTEEVEEVEETTEETTGETVTIKVQTIVEALEPLLADFTALTGIEVEHELGPGAVQASMLLPFFESGDTPYDVTAMDDDSVVLFSVSDHLMPLDDIIPQETWDDFDSVMDARFDVFDKNSKGEMIRIPYNLEFSYFYVRTDMFEEKGLDLPETWEDVIEVGKVFAQDGTWGLLDSLVAGGFAYVTASYLAGQAGGDIYAFDEGTAVAFQHVYDMIHVHKIFPEEAINKGYEEINQDFMADKTAMMRQWPYADGIFKSNEDWYEEGKFEITLPPKGPVNAASWTGAWGWSIPTYTENLDAASQFLVWVTSAEVQAKLAAANGHYMPPRKEVLELVGDQGVAPVMSMYLEAGALAPRPFHLKATEAGAIVEEVFVAYLMDQTTLEEAMENGKALMAELGDRYPQ